MAVTSDDAIVKAAVSSFQTSKSVVDSATNVATKAFNQITDTNFLVSAGIGAAAGLFASRVSRPSLSFPALAASAQVALSVGNLLKAGAVKDSDIRNAENGLNLSKKIQPPPAINLSGSPKEVSNYIDEAVSFVTETNIMRLPNDVSSQYNMKIQLFNYTKDIRKGSISGSPTDIFVLPLPANLVDAITLQYNNVNLGPLLGEFSQETEKLIDVFRSAGMVDALSETYQGVMGAIRSGAAADVMQILGRRALSGISEAAASAVDLSLGNTPNPHQVVTFNGVNLRTFRFAWRFSPNNLDESNNLKKFIMRMKKKTLPKQSKSGFLLDYPSIAKIVLKPQPINDLFQFRSLFIDSLSVNYAPSGSLSFHKDQMPSEVEVTISLREFDIQTSESYSDTGVRFEERGSPD